MDQSLRDLYMKGWITLEEALSRAMNPEELKKMISPTTVTEGTVVARGR
jgi:Tfp pilus assembly ATPase PilU